MAGKKQKDGVSVTVFLDRGDSEYVREQLRLQGRSFSSFIDACCREYRSALAGTSAELKKPLMELTLSEFGQLLKEHSRLLSGTSSDEE